jgi:hypothetical protein
MGNIQESYHNNILTISGTGRNVGKTSLACRIIHKLARTQKLTAVKISPHFHKVDYPKALFEQPGAYSLYREGADPVYYIQTRDIHLSDAWKKLSQLIDKGYPVVIESGGLDRLMNPGLSIIVTNPDSMDEKKQKRPGLKQIETRSEKFDQLINSICFCQGSWKLNK